MSTPLLTGDFSPLEQGDSPTVLFGRRTSSNQLDEFWTASLPVISVPLRTISVCFPPRYLASDRDRSINELPYTGSDPIFSMVSSGALSCYCGADPPS